MGAGYAARQLKEEAVRHKGGKGKKKIKGAGAGGAGVRGALGVASQTG